MVKRCLSLLGRWWQRQQWLKTRFMDAELVIVDLELTGLDAKQHEIVSAAWVPLSKGQIHLSGATHIINRDVKALEQSPVFHGLCQSHIDAGLALETFTTKLAAAIEDRVVVFHHSHLDMAFIRNLFHAQGIKARPRLIIDTLQLERRRLLAKGLEIGQDDLTLEDSRKRYGLPQYSGHHALTDALATGELLLAQVHQIGGLNQLKLAELV